MRMKLLAGSIALAMGTSFAYASAIVDNFKADLKNEGVIVQDKAMYQFVDCLVSDAEPCKNFANTSLNYSGQLFPCPVTGCHAASPGLVIPLPDRSIMLLPADATWTIEENEAMVMYAVAPPGVTHFGFETLVYERAKNQIPNPDGFTPLKEGEVQPDPKRGDTGVVIDSGVGDTLNEFTMKTVRNPEKRRGLKRDKEQVFVHIASPNQLLAEKLKETFIQNGFPEEGINIKGLPEEHFTFSNDPAIGDTFRTIGRYARPFEDQEAFDAWMQSEPYQLMRITDPEVGYKAFPVEELIEPETGKNELEGRNIKKYEQWTEESREVYGEPTKIADIIPRNYNSEHCISTGSYCWGNNNDADYIDILDPETEKFVIVDLGSNPDNKVVISGVDHVASNYAKFWNFGFYHPETAESISTVDFDKVQLQDYGKRPTFLKRGGPDNLFFRFEVKADCAGAENCYEVDISQTGGKVKMMMRTYVNPQTGTMPANSEMQNPEIWVYEN